MKSLKLPPVGLGTYKLTGSDCEKATEWAYQLGYRHFDTATFYENEHIIGKVLSRYPRQDYQLTTKVWYDELGYHKTLHACDRSLNALKTEYLDLYLIHWPHPREMIFETFEAIEELKAKGRVRHYGASNFTIRHLRDALEAGFKPEANQVEFHPYLVQQELLDFCEHEEIQLISYSPLLRGELLYDATINQIAQNYQKSAAQVVLRWLSQKNVIAIPMSGDQAHLRDNLDIFDFDLKDEEVLKINHLHRNYRQTNPDCSDFDY